jgi:hypothetical protein
LTILRPMLLRRALENAGVDVERAWACDAELCEIVVCGINFTLVG